MARLLRHTLDLADGALDSPRPERGTEYILATLNDLAGELAHLRAALGKRPV